MVIMLRKMMLIFVATFVSTQGKTYQALIVQIVIAFYLAAHLSALPFIDRAYNMMESLSLISAFVTMYAGYYFLASTDDPSTTSKNDFTLSEAVKTIFFLVIVVFQVAFLVVWLYQMHLEIKRTIRGYNLKWYKRIYHCSKKYKVMSNDDFERQIARGKMCEDLVDLIDCVGNDMEYLWEEKENEKLENKNEFEDTLALVAPIIEQIRKVMKGQKDKVNFGIEEDDLDNQSGSGFKRFGRSQFKDMASDLLRKNKILSVISGSKKIAQSEFGGSESILEVRQSPLPIITTNKVHSEIENPVEKAAKKKKRRNRLRKKSTVNYDALHKADASLRQMINKYSAGNTLDAKNPHQDDSDEISSEDIEESSELGSPRFKDEDLNEPKSAPNNQNGSGSPTNKIAKVISPKSTSVIVNSEKKKTAKMDSIPEEEKFEQTSQNDVLAKPENPVFSPEQLNTENLYGDKADNSRNPIDMFINDANHADATIDEIRDKVENDEEENKK